MSPRKIRYLKEDKEWARLVKDRDKWRCQRCQKAYSENDRGLHAAHIFSRRLKSTRHDPLNGIALCFGCHSHFHAYPLEAHEWFEEHLGAAQYAELQARAKKLRT